MGILGESTVSIIRVVVRPTFGAWAMLRGGADQGSYWNIYNKSWIIYNTSSVHKAF